MSEESKAIVPITESFRALSKASELGEIVKANFGSEGISIFDLERIVLGSGGAQTFRIIDGLGESSADNFEAVICFMRSGRTWWEAAYGEGGGDSPPDCSSDDLMTGIGNNGAGDGHGPHNCASCPNNAWGSDRSGGIGKDCKESKTLFLLRRGREDDIFPSILVVPPGSLRGFARYMTAITSRGLAFYAAMHRFSLGKAQTKGGLAYSTLKVELVRELADGEKSSLIEYAKALREPFTGVRASQADVSGGGSDGAG